RLRGGWRSAAGHPALHPHLGRDIRAGGHVLRHAVLRQAGDPAFPSALKTQEQITTPGPRTRGISIMCRSRWALLPVVLLTVGYARGQEAETKPSNPFSTSTFTGLRLRSVGPAVTSGRVTGIAVHPRDRGHYFVAAASGGVWMTTNAGTTW